MFSFAFTICQFCVSCWLVGFCFFLFFLSCAMWLVRSWCSSQELGLSHWGGRPESRALNHQRTPDLLEYLWVFSQRFPSLHLDLAPPNGQQAPVLDDSCPTTSKTVTQTHPLADKLPKAILGWQTAKNTPLDPALVIRGIRSSSTHHNRGTVPPPGSLQKAVVQPHPQGADTTSKNYNPEACRNETPNKMRR